MKYGFEFGLISEADYEKSRTKTLRIKQEIEKLRTTKRHDATLDRILRRPEVTYKEMIDSGICVTELNEEEMGLVEIEVKYGGYISRQAAEVNRFKKMEKRHIPSTLDYSKINGISREALEKLLKVRPFSIGQAARIPGISPCDLSLLAVYVEKSARS